MDFLTSLVSSNTALRRWYVLSLICNMVIVVTGGIVRVTGSGLGCSTWPSCTADSLVPTPELGIHGAIEFSNRTLTFVLTAAAVGAIITTYRVMGTHHRLFWVTVLIGLGIVVQAVVGGISVRMELNSWVVGLHFLGSVILIVLCTLAVVWAFDRAPEAISTAKRVLVIATFTAAIAASCFGVIVTGAGPHAGDADVERNGLDIHRITQVHGASAWLLLILSLVSLVVLWKLTDARRASIALVASIVYQGVVGYTQYFTGLPRALVVMHLAGVTLIAAAATWLLAVGSAQQRIDSDRKEQQSQVTV